MKYQMLLWPHANARYRMETIRLACAELRVMMDVLCPQAEISADEEATVPTLYIETQAPLESNVIEAISRHSLMYVLYECRENGLLLPVAGRGAEYIGEDLPSILKYKGKTNELFLKMLINIGMYSSDYAKAEERIEMLDPMCGRGTSVFTAANFGWNATGSDVDKKDLSEASLFLKRYLEYHKMKYSMRKESRTVKSGKAIPVTEFVYAQDAEAMKRKDTRAIRFAETDAGKVTHLAGKDKFHLIVTDLPYGVQHAPEKSSFEALLARIFPVWRETLKKGGTVTVSFNTNTLKRDRVRELMNAAGFEVITGGAYDGFAHWVEQAVTRDIVVGRK